MNKKDMAKPRRRLLARFIQIVWILSIAFVAYLSLTPRSSFPFNFNEIDKVYHFLIYLWLAAVPFLGFQSVKIALVGALLMLPFGIALEYAQVYVPGLVFDVADMIANGLGVALGMVLGRLLQSRLFASPQTG